MLADMSARGFPPEVLPAFLAVVAWCGCGGNGQTEPVDEVACVASGDQGTINQALTGPGSVAVLCQDAEFDLTASVVFTADGQQVSTEGFPTDDRRAL